jgi:hypothetical protein
MCQILVKSSYGWSPIYHLHHNFFNLQPWSLLLRSLAAVHLQIKIGWRKFKTCPFGAPKWLQSARLEHNTQRHTRYVLHTSASKVNTASEKCPRRGMGRVCRQIWIALAGNLSRQSCGRYVWEGVFEHVVGIVEVLSAGTRQRRSGRDWRRLVLCCCRIGKGFQGFQLLGFTWRD